MKLCKHCNFNYPTTSFYKNQGRCKSCWNEMIKQRQKDLKKKAVLYKGGCCSRCGYFKCFGALEFHHIDAQQKDFEIGATRSWSWKRIQPELDKCILVCSNCHRELHSDNH